MSKTGVLDSFFKNTALAKDRRERTSAWVFIAVIYLAMAWFALHVIDMKLPPPPEIPTAYKINEILAGSAKDQGLEKRYETMTNLDLAEEIKELQKLHYMVMEKFNPPGNNHLTEDQIERFNTAYLNALDEMNDFKYNRIKKAGLGTIQAVTFYALAEGMAYHLWFKHLARVNMTINEADWVKNQMMETAMFAINRTLETGPVNDEEEKHLHHLRESIAGNLGFVIEENHEKKPDPDSVDTSKVRLHNLILFLKDPLKFRYISVNFKPGDWSEPVHFNKQDIIQHAKDVGLSE